MTDNLPNPQPQSPQLPRSGWKSQISYFKIVLQAKQNLDRDEAKWRNQDHSIDRQSIE
jgi:hypothetical protein